MYYSELDDIYYLDGDAVYSDIYEDYIYKDDAIEVFTSINKTKSSYVLYSNNDDYITILDENNEKIYYWTGLIDYFILVITSINPLIQKWDYKSNEHKYFKMKGKYYLKKFEDDLTGQLKLNF